MPKCLVECKYCGHAHKTWVFSGYDGEYSERCIKCGDPNTEVTETDESTKDVFGYNWELKRKSYYGKE